MLLLVVLSSSSSLLLFLFFVFSYLLPHRNQNFFKSFTSSTHYLVSLAPSLPSFSKFRSTLFLFTRCFSYYLLPSSCISAGSFRIMTSYHPIVYFTLDIFATRDVIINDDDDVSAGCHLRLLCSVARYINVFLIETTYV